MLRLKRLSPMTKRVLLTIVGLLVLLFLIVGIRGCQIYGAIKKFEGMHLPSPMVSTTTAKAITWHPYINSVGSLTAIQGINVSSQVSGVVTKIDFDSGQLIKQGQIIVVLDTNVLQAQLDNAKAALTLAQITFDRQGKLYQQSAISKSDYDSAKATLDQDQANVAQQQALLNQKIIRAPFTGVLGIREVSLGQFVNAGDMITNLQQLDPIFVDYSVPQETVSQLYVNQPVEVTLPAYPKVIFKGKVTAIGKQLDATTRSISVRAELTNANEQLLPGMFITVHTMLPPLSNVVTVPQSAITYTLYGDSVFVVVPQTQAEAAEAATKVKIPSTFTGYQVKQVYITTGAMQQDQVAVTKGFKAGDIVVTAGQIKLQNGSSVALDKDTQK
jgi:membrane fusion protein (multidrug efflux system)